MTQLFISIRFLDVLDIVLVAFLFYQVYMLLRGSVAFNIFIGLFAVYLLWLVVKAMNMSLLSTILGQFIGVGVIAVIIVFQQELRSFLLMIGTRYMRNNRFNLEKWFSFGYKMPNNENITNIVDACKSMSKNKTGALIVISRKSSLESIINSGQTMNARVSTGLIENIFFKNSPLHDGAMVISGNIIKSVRCILPISEKTNVPEHFGMRHRAAIGLSEETDATIIVVSEQTGDISYFDDQGMDVSISPEQLTEKLEFEFGGKKVKKMAESVA